MSDEAGREAEVEGEEGAELLMSPVEEADGATAEGIETAAVDTTAGALVRVTSLTEVVVFGACWTGVVIGGDTLGDRGKVGGTVSSHRSMDGSHSVAST